ncbi:MAG: DUF4390 domain-containing protein [Thermoanaerobaculia bacterium]|nr:MAG: DUF4390 domain-containing protein [Thermoanaerobaculia bacterium]
MKAFPALILAGLLAAPAAADEPAVRDLSIALDGVQVLASFRLAGGLTPELRERIESGLPTGFLFELDLLRDRQRWWDESLDSTRIEVVAMFNAVTREYLVNTKLEGKLIDSRTLRDADELERVMTRFQAVPVFVLRSPSRRERYLVRARAELGTGNLLGFVPVMRATPWVESNKVRFREP